MPPSKFKITVPDIDHCQQYATFLYSLPTGERNTLELELSEAFLKKHPIYAAGDVKFPDAWNTDPDRCRAAAEKFTAITTRSALDSIATLESHLLHLGPNRPSNLTLATFMFMLVLMLVSQFLAEQLFKWTDGPVVVSDAAIARALDPANNRM